MKIRWAIVTLFVLLVVCGTKAAQCKSSDPSEQVQFSAEDAGVKRPVAIPEDILSVLRKDETVLIVLKDQGRPAEMMPSSWFSASTIHLNGTEESDLVVKGETPILGANVTIFWVFRAVGHGHELVLTAPAHDLVVKNTRWNGHREIEMMSATASNVSTVLYRFDGKRYAAFQEKSEQIH